LVQFYRSSDEKSVNAFKDKFVLLAAKLSKDGVKVGAVNCESERELCSSNAIRKTPSFKLIFNGESVAYDDTAENGVTAKDLYQFCLETLPNKVINVRTLQQAEEFYSRTIADKKKSSLGVGIILFTTKFDTPLMLKTLAHQHLNNVVVGEVRGGNSQVASHFGISVEKMPSLVVVCAGKEPLANMAFDGDLRDSDATAKFIQKSTKPNFCNQIRVDGEKTRKAKDSQLQGFLSLTRAQLMKKKVSELKFILEQLKISTTSLFEKTDFVDKVLSLKAHEL